MTTDASFGPARSGQVVSLTTSIALALTLLAAPSARVRADAGAPTPDEVAEPLLPSAVEGTELMVNAFRTPSIGLELRYRFLSVHAGAYTTVIDEGASGFSGASWFFKAGLTLHFLPVEVFGTRLSSFYAGASVVHDIGDGTWGTGVVGEVGFRLSIWKGSFARLGVAVLGAPNRECAEGASCARVRVNPTPGVGWGFTL